MESFENAIAQTKSKAERHVDQFQDFADAQNELIRSGICLLTGNSYAEDYKQFLRLVRHVEELWHVACTLFRAKSYPQSLFLAISTLEETGKIGVARFQIVLRNLAREKGIPIKVPNKIKRKGNPFFSHPEKHLLVAGAGAVINSRLDRILGVEHVCKFLNDVRDGKVEQLRQSSLYANYGNAGPTVPSELISEDTARFYVILAGELMAEILGFEPPEWERLLKDVQSFEREIGHPWD